MLFVPKHCILGHVNLDFPHSDEPVFIVPMLGGGLNLEDVLLGIARKRSGQWHGMHTDEEGDFRTQTETAGRGHTLFSTSAACFASVYIVEICDKDSLQWATPEYRYPLISLR